LARIDQAKRTDKKKLNLALIVLNLAAKCFDLAAKKRENALKI